MLEIRGIWHCHMSRWDRYVLRPRIWMETSRSGTLLYIGPYKKLAKFDNLCLKVDSLALDVEMLKIRTSPLEDSKATPINAIQLQINENIMMMAKIKERWAREKEEEDRIKSLPTHHTVATIQIVEDIKT